VQDIDQLLLVNGLDTSKQTCVLDGLDTLLLVHLLELGTSESLASSILILIKDTNLTADSNGGVLESTVD
jgi:hypothetical protein